MSGPKLELGSLGYFPSVSAASKSLLYPLSHSIFVGNPAAPKPLGPSDQYSYLKTSF